MLPICVFLCWVAACVFGPAAAVNPGNIVLTAKDIVGEVEDMLWVGSTKQVVLLLTDRGILYRSTNEGMTWQEQTEFLHAAMGDKEHFDHDLSIMALTTHDLRSDYIIFQGIGPLTFTTQDGGAHYVAIDKGLTFHELKMHPLDPHKILASTMSDKCNNPEAEGYCYKNLHYSSNFGQSWTFMRHYIVQFDWAHKLGSHVPHTMSRDSIFFTEYNSKYYDQKFGFV